VYLLAFLLNVFTSPLDMIWSGGADYISVPVFWAWNVLNVLRVACALLPWALLCIPTPRAITALDNAAYDVKT
jgi:hypothetical protein